MNFARDRHPYFLSTIQLVNKLEVVIPLLLSMALALIPSGIIRSERYAGSLIIGGVAVLVILAILRAVHMQPSQRAQLTFTVAFHLVLSVILLTITGFQSPVLIFWLGLLILSYVNHGRGGFMLSVLLLLLTAFFDAAIQSNYFVADLTYYTRLLVSLIAIGAVSYIIANIVAGAALAQEALLRSRTAQSFERDRLRTLVNSMGEGVITTDPSGVIRLHNSAALAILDTNQSFIGKNIGRVFSLVDESQEAVNFKQLFKAAHGPTVRRDLSHKLAGDEAISLFLQITPIRGVYHESGEPGYLVIFRDITKEKSLDDERDEFISVVSHELRTPIAIAEGSLSNLVLMQSRGANQAVVAQAADTAHKQVLFLASMINDLSTLSRAERGVTDQQNLVQVEELVRETYNKYLPQAADKGLALHLDLAAQLPSLIQNRLYLEEVLQNFVTNAIKYTPSGSVTIHVHKVDNSIEFAVSDTGIGISKSDQAKVFQKFYRAEDYRTRETSGTGLGLYVVQKLANKLGTRIELTSRLNHGSRFSFRLPLPTKAQQAALDQTA